MSTSTLNPLVTDSERFALDRSRITSTRSDATSHTTRPFGLRFATDPAPIDDRPLPAWRLCPQTQVALATDGTPWHRTVTAMAMSTTGPSPDGGGSTGGEEWRPDYQSDVDSDLA